jgi:hypothetical protein
VRDARTYECPPKGDQRGGALAERTHQSPFNKHPAIPPPAYYVDNRRLARNGTHLH